MIEGIHGRSPDWTPHRHQDYYISSLVFYPLFFLLLAFLTPFLSPSNQAYFMLSHPLQADLSDHSLGLQSLLIFYSHDEELGSQSLCTLFAHSHLCVSITKGPPNDCVCVGGLSVHSHECVCICICVGAYVCNGGLTSAFGVLLDHSLPYCLRQGLSQNLELIN